MKFYYVIIHLLDHISIIPSICSNYRKVFIEHSVTRYNINNNR